MSSALHGEMARHLLRSDGQEDLCFAIWHPSSGAERGTVLLSRIVMPSTMDRQVHGNVSFEGSYFLRAAQEAATVSIERAATVPLPKFNSHLLPVERDEPLRLEIQSFLAAVSGTPIEVTGTDGRNALELALGITQKIDEHLKKTRAPYHKP